MFCPKCGNQLDDSARFCGRCGAALGAGQAQAQTQGQARESTSYGAQPVQAPRDLTPKAPAPSVLKGTRQAPSLYDTPIPGPSRPASGPAQSGGGLSGLLSNKISLIALIASALWIVAMLWMPFQSVFGHGLSNVDVISNPAMYIAMVLIFGGVTCFDCVARSGRDILFSGILMVIWTLRSVFETTANNWDLAFGAFLSIICFAAVVACGAYQLFLNTKRS